MDTEQPPKPPAPSAWQADDPTPLPPTALQAPSRAGFRMQCILLGLATVFVVGSLLYGPNVTLQAAGLLVICTLGIGLIPLLLVSWIVGWVELAAWDAVKEARGRSGPAVPQGSTKG